MTLSRQVLRKVDDALRNEFDQEQGEWMAKVPISGATKGSGRDTVRRSVLGWVRASPC